MIWPFGKTKPAEVRVSPENPSVSLTNPATWSWLSLGRSEAGVVVTEATATEIPAVFACVSRISQTIGSLPVHVFERTPTGSQRVETGVIPRLLAVETNDFQSSTDFRQVAEAHLDLWGNAYAAVERNGRGDVVGLVPLDPSRMTVERRGGKVRYLATLLDNTRVEMQASEVVHLKHWGIDGLVGWSPIRQAAGSLGLAKAAENYGGRFFANDARPGVILEHPGRLSDAAIARIKDSWEAKFSGPNQHRPAALEEGMKLHEVGIPPEDAQYIETRRYAKEEIASLYGVPQSLIQSVGSQSYNSAEQDDLVFTKYCIGPRVAIWEAELNRKLFSSRSGDRYYVKFNLNGLMRGAFRDRMAALVQAVQGGLMTPNEARSLEELPPLDGGDTLYLQQNMAGVQAIQDGSAGNQVANATSTKEQIVNEQEGSDA